MPSARSGGRQRCEIVAVITTISGARPWCGQAADKVIIARQRDRGRSAQLWSGSVKLCGHVRVIYLISGHFDLLSSVSAPGPTNHLTQTRFQHSQGGHSMVSRSAVRDCDQTVDHHSKKARKIKCERASKARKPEE